MYVGELEESFKQIGKWKELSFFSNDKFKEVCKKLANANGNKILPAEADNVLRAFRMVNLYDVRVVILGQDPYPDKKHATGLAFSVPSRVKMSKLPASLKNIYWELLCDVGHMPKNGSLVGWARQGVFLLNTTLTVQEGKRNSHSGFGWHHLAEEALANISSEQDRCVFMLWGKPAQKAGKKIDCCKHLVIKSSHPSPKTACQGHQPFCGSQPFSHANNWLSDHGINTIDWGRSE